jgi:Tfp pilus assembly protein PilN
MIERIEINLLPATYRIHKKTIKLKRSVVYPLLIVVFMGFCAFIATFNIDSRVSQLKSDIRRTDESIKKNMSIKDEIAKIKENRQEVESKIAALEKINIDRAEWVRLMEVICRKMPEFTWLVSCEQKDSVLVVEGRTFSLQQVADLMTGLSGGPSIKSVELSGIEEKDEAKTFSFTVSCKLNSKREPLQGGKK